MVELKRPLLSLGRKELDQVEDYVNAIRDDPEFLHTNTTWNFFLIATEFKPEIHGRIYQKDRPAGLVQVGENYELWVKTWAEITRENEARLQFVQDKLSVEVSDVEIEARIAELRQIVLR